MEKSAKKKILKPNTKTITTETPLGEVLELCPEAAGIFFEAGLHCLGCGGAAFETIEQGASAHGISPEKITEIVKRINELMKKR